MVGRCTVWKLFLPHMTYTAFKGVYYSLHCIYMAQTIFFIHYYKNIWFHRKTLQILCKLLGFSQIWHFTRVMNSMSSFENWKVWEEKPFVSYKMRDLLQCENLLAWKWTYTVTYNFNCLSALKILCTWFKKIWKLFVPQV